ncbi:hypothetical protein ABZ499_23945 [Streptomyces sp. NPDC019990]|uniref:hypothetical protein n=1 Tax=Streptomyces sp. NPDC019990 TaxID=3154693 RepID=UPI0033E2185D
MHSRIGREVRRLLQEAGAGPEPPGPHPGGEAVGQHAPDGRRRLVLINHRTATPHLPEPAHDLLTGAVAHEVPPGGRAVLRKP